MALCKEHVEKLADKIAEKLEDIEEGEEVKEHCPIALLLERNHKLKMLGIKCPFYDICERKDKGMYKECR